MKKAKKIVALLLCAVLLIGASVAGTLAYLTFTTNEVKNTFTVGKVELGEQGKGGLDETDVDEYGVAIANADRVTENTYKLIPDHSYIKDPTLHIKKGSEQCYVFVKVVNGISAIEAADVEGETATTIAGQMAAEGWKQLKINGEDVANVFYKENAVDARNITTDYLDVKVFSSFKLAKTADVSGYKDATITVIGYAIQADGFTSAEEAWAAAPSSWTVAADPATPGEG